MIILYISSVSSSLEIKKKQVHIESTLQSLKIPFQTRDVATNAEFRATMQNKSGQKVPPQLFRDDEYLGDHEAFTNALEEKALNDFLGISSSS